MLIVKAVDSSSVFRSAICGSPSWSPRSPVSARQIRPRPCERHEVDHLRRDQLGRADQIAFVLPVFVIGDDDDFPVADVFDRLLNRPEGGHRIGER